MNKNKTILVAPLNWGLGHATRCIPIINALMALDFKVIIASDGAALLFLQKEFPELTFEELPAYNIRYAKRRKFFKTKMLRQSPQILKAIFKEHKLTGRLIKKYNLDGIISDNRYGLRRKGIPSVMITHQLKVLSGRTTVLSAGLQKKMLKRFDAIWVPDFKDSHTLSGDLGHAGNWGKKLSYIGPQSRFSASELPNKYDITCVLSGPEPQRGMLEAKLMSLLTNTTKQVLFIGGLVEEVQKITRQGNITRYNYMSSKQLEDAMSQSEVIVCRSGYSMLMDLAVLQKKAFLIPTPGQYEQEYLAGHLEDRKMLPFNTQNEFNLIDLERLKSYSGLPAVNKYDMYEQLFSLF